MNLYKIEYHYNKDKHLQDLADGRLMPLKFSKEEPDFTQLWTHVLAEDFMEAVEKVKSLDYLTSDYLEVVNVSLVEIGIKIL